MSLLSSFRRRDSKRPFFIILFIVIIILISKLLFDKQIYLQSSNVNIAELVLEHSLYLDMPLLLLDPRVLYKTYLEKNNDVLSDSIQKYLVEKSTVSLGLLEFRENQIKQLLWKMKRENVNTWIKSEPDPRYLSHHGELGPDIFTHIIFWTRPSLKSYPKCLQLILFYKRNDFLWHGSILDKRDKNTLDRPSCLQLFGLSSAAFESFQTEAVSVFSNKFQLQIPSNILMYIKDQREARFIECDYQRAKKFFKKYKPKKNYVFREDARIVLNKTRKVLRQLGVPFWIESGTLLGWLRQCDVFPDDVDIGIHIGDFTPKIFKALMESGMQPLTIYGLINDSYSFALQQGSVKMDVFFYYKDVKRNKVWNGIVIPPTGEKFKLIYSPFKLCYSELLGVLVRVPCPAEPMVMSDYGKDYNIPITRKWLYASDPKNIEKAGFWSQHQRKDAIIIFD